MTRQASSGKNGEEPTVKVPTVGWQRAEELKTAAWARRRRRYRDDGGEERGDENDERIVRMSYLV